MNQQSRTIRLLVTIVAIIMLLGGLVGSQPAAAGYATGPSQSVIVQAASADQAAALVARYGGTVTSRLEIIQGVGALVPQSKLAALKSEPNVRVTDNAETRLTNQDFSQEPKRRKTTPESDYPDVTGADLAWAEGATGKGIGVAVLDTGIANHPALKRNINNRKAKIVGWVDFVNGKRSPHDPNGHGTHIAGIIGNASVGTDGEYNGMAPGVNLIGVRVLDDNGAGNYEKVIQGIQWVLNNKDRYNIKIINLSLHALVQSPYWADPLNQAVMQAWAQGITVVVAAGNNGPNPMSISVPGNNPYVITVGAFTDAYTPDDWSDDYLAEFSAAGPTLDGFVKPDLLAPGAHMTSTMLPGSKIARNHEANWVDGLYFSMAGTSQAAAVISGAAALILDQRPELTPDEIKFRLELTSLVWVNSDHNDVLYSMWQQGAGRVNAYDAALADNIQGTANRNMDIWADLDGTQHYEGHSYFDEASGKFLLHGYETAAGGYGAWAGGYGAWADGYGAWADGYGAWADGYGAWADGYGAWADGYGAWADGYGAWAGGYGAWAGGYGAWAGGYGAWAGGYGAWAGGYGAWAGGYGAWAGGYGAWAGGYGAWAGGYGAWAGNYYDPTFYDNFANGVSPAVNTSTTPLNWIEEPE